MLLISLALISRIATPKIEKEDCRSKAIIRGEREICQGDQNKEAEMTQKNISGHSTSTSQ